MTEAIELRINKKISKSFGIIKDDIGNELDNILLETNIGENFKMVKERFEKIKTVLDNTELITITQEDLLKRKRVKNFVPYFDRCIGKKSNGEQCTRKRRDGLNLCGTHEKGTPHGRISDINKCVLKVGVCAHEVNGIVYYVDEKGNVYDTCDVHSNVKNPRIIARSIEELTKN